MDTETKNKQHLGLILATVLLVIVLILAYSPAGKKWLASLKKTQRTQVPKEFILSQDNLEKIHQDFNNVDFARYMVSQGPREVYNYFLNKLQKEKWEVVVNNASQMAGESGEGIIFAQNQKNRVNIFISQEKDSNQTKVEITFLPK